MIRTPTGLRARRDLTLALVSCRSLPFAIEASLCQIRLICYGIRRRMDSGRHNLRPRILQTENTHVKSRFAHFVVLSLRSLGFRGRTAALSATKAANFAKISKEFKPPGR